MGALCTLPKSTMIVPYNTMSNHAVLCMRMQCKDWTQNKVRTPYTTYLSYVLIYRTKSWSSIKIAHTDTTQHKMGSRLFINYACLPSISFHLPPYPNPLHLPIPHFLSLFFPIPSTSIPLPSTPHHTTNS